MNAGGRARGVRSRARALTSLACNDNAGIWLASIQRHTKLWLVDSASWQHSRLTRMRTGHSAPYPPRSRAVLMRVMHV